MTKVHQLDSKSCPQTIFFCSSGQCDSVNHVSTDIGPSRPAPETESNSTCRGYGAQSEGVCFTVVAAVAAEESAIIEPKQKPDLKPASSTCTLSRPGALATRMGITSLAEYNQDL